MGDTGFERYLERILDRVHEGIAVIDADGKYSFVNPVGERILGKQRDDILGHDHRDPIWQLENADGTEIGVDEMPATKVIETGEPVYGGEYARRRSDGSRSMIMIDAEPFHDAGGRLVGALISFSDVTVARRTQHLSDALNEINNHLASSRDIDTVMQRTVDSAVAALGCESGVIYLRRDDDWIASYVCNLPESMVGTRIPEARASFTTLTAGPVGAIAFNDAFEDERIDSELMRELGVRSLLDVVLRIHGKLVVDMSFQYHSAAVKFTQQDVDFANKLGTSVGLALENAKLYEEEQYLIGSLQAALLKVPPEIEGVDFAHAYRSGGDIGEVGGDFYDVFECEDGRLGIVLGDVSGKGIEAASVAAEAKNTAKAHLFDGRSPAAAATKINTMLAASTATNIFVTAFLARLDMSSGGLTYCCAGHPAPLIHRPSTGAEALTVSSSLLGAVTGLEYVDESAHMDRGDRLLAYTDGVTEARQDGEFYGGHRLERLVDDVAPGSSTALVDTVVGDILDFTNNQLSDDVAVLAVARAAF